MRKSLIALVLISISLNSCTKNTSTLSNHETSKVHWQSEWNDQVFQDAKKNNKLIILNLEAIWCHWCHVMGAETYANDDVAKLLNDNFIALKIDQDSNAYLSNRYKDHGWPATIIFNSQGEEIVKRAGYIEPESMKQLLLAVIKDPSPESDYSKTIQYSKTSSLSEDLKKQLEANYLSSIDLDIGGLKLSQKYIDRDTVEYALIRSKEEGTPLKDSKTLENALNIMDPVWGGFYQYSTHGDWIHPHYEKLSTVQAEYLRIYSLAQLQYPNPVYKDAIRQTIKYINNFLTDKKTGVFYTSQDADLIQGKKASDYFNLNNKARRAQGIPRVDKNVYADRNGRIIEALAYAYRTNHNPRLIDKAIKAINTLNRTHKHGNFYKHDSHSMNSYLSDNLYMTAALLALYEVTADRKWLESAKRTAEYIIINYRSDEPGYLSNDKRERRANAKLNALLKPSPVLDENLKLARLFNLLSHYTGITKFKDEAKYIMQYLGSKDVALDSISEPGILILNRELAEDPVHFTIIGSKKDPKAKELFLAALQYPASYIRIEWYDRSGRVLMNPDVEYPKLAQAAAFSCIDHSCSLPIYDKAELLI